ncbi:orotidine 5'-phosphate decarboxylase [Fictibacillus macauensis ZFHKF-1]|uniref:Orotidine 5'-phosphate decarboxylase n=1 Tax=Fictibacillus macauensis ZFHKF-1 TaxID=1196324 RepID=I8UDQ5_9BACL|nr:orotidine-5'-phosphate decarboxylase [Fictibacillus macauensis]EIT85025.1 orotidine 5'-phosphate decarboxylase [Fictibacillus macauensis ZFHKF-1]
MGSPVIVALDFANLRSAQSFLENFKGKDLWVKVGMELFYEEGPALIAALKEQQFSVFLDLKLHDIPTTVYKAMKRLAALDVDMVNVHAAGGVAMMKAALAGLEEGASKKRPHCIAVTQLTSTTSAMLSDELLIATPMQDCIGHYASLAHESGLDGVVCSPLEVPHIKQVCGSSFLTVTPGIRLAGDAHHDQQRVTQPKEAKALGADYIVVGRSITESHEPVAVYERILQDWSAHNETTHC